MVKKLIYVLIGAGAALTAFVLIAQSSASHNATCNGQRATIRGTDGNDVLIGTRGDDIIAGSSGTDYILAKGGNDLVCAGTGEDSVNGGDGDDVIYLGDGDDYAWGRLGNDRMFGEVGYDYLLGQRGDDYLDAGPAPWDGADYCNGYYGADTLVDCENPEDIDQPPVP